MKIDLVYLYVNGNDPQWQAKKRQWGANVTVGNAECRFCDNQELRYSLRSVEKYAPWINRIFIVTDNQIPEWLNTSHEKIQMVDHREIVDEKYLPLFNSQVLTAHLANIPNLSEHFIYSDDDFFFCRPVEKNFFFDDAGRPIIRYSKKMSRIPNGIYGASIWMAQSLIFDKYGEKAHYYPHHNMDSYLKSEFLNCRQEFPELFLEPLKWRFRAKTYETRFGVLQYMQSRGTAVAKFENTSRLKKIQALLRFSQLDSLYMASKRGNFAQKIRRYRPQLACINDGVNQNELIGQFFDEMFPEKSSFEK